MQDLLIIVEGEGEVRAAPVLVRRLLEENLGIYGCRIDTHRRHGLDHLRANNWERLRRYIAAAYCEGIPVLWIVDCDDDCAWHIASEMAHEISRSGPRQPTAVALLPREYETMFIFDIAATCETFRIDPPVDRPADPKLIRGAKGWIDRRLPKGVAYKETIDQARISARLNLTLLEAEYDDFGHLCRALRWLSEQGDPIIYPIAEPGPR